MSECKTYALMLAALEMAEQFNQHCDADHCGCDGDCPEAWELWATFNSQAKDALAAARRPAEARP